MMPCAGQHLLVSQGCVQGEIWWFGAGGVISGHGGWVRRGGWVGGEGDWATGALTKLLRTKAVSFSIRTSSLCMGCLKMLLCHLALHWQQHPAACTYFSMIVSHSIHIVQQGYFSIDLAMRMSLIVHIVLCLLLIYPAVGVCTRGNLTCSAETQEQPCS